MFSLVCLTGLLLLLLLPPPLPAAPDCVTHDFVVIRAVDGDTVTIRVPGLPPPVDGPLSLRIRGVDCPESGHRALCPAEAALAEAAATFTRAAIADPGVAGVELCGWDKYGGRVLGDVLLRRSPARRLSEALIASGHAAPYLARGAAPPAVAASGVGRGPKRDWCASSGSGQRADDDDDGGRGGQRRGGDGCAAHLLDDGGPLAGE